MRQRIDRVVFTPELVYGVNIPAAGLGVGFQAYVTLGLHKVNGVVAVAHGFSHVPAGALT